MEAGAEVVKISQRPSGFAAVNVNWKRYSNKKTTEDRPITI